MSLLSWLQFHQFLDQLRCLPEPRIRSSVLPNHLGEINMSEIITVTAQQPSAILQITQTGKLVKRAHGGGIATAVGQMI
jgi:hypothetical protein